MRPTRRWQLTGAALVCFAVAGSVTSCIDDGRGYVFVDFGTQLATFVEGEDGLRIRFELEPSIDTDGLALLDSALVVVNHDGQSTSLPDPDIEADGFPIGSYEQTTIVLEVPSPISDITSFDAFCAANGRSADVTLRFFTTTIDPDPSEPPPVTEFTTNVPITLPGAPDAPDVIGGGDVSTLGTLGSPVVKNVVAGPGDQILFMVSAGLQPSLTAFLAAPQNEQSIELTGLVGYPRLASDDPEVLYIAGVSNSDALRFVRLTGADESELRIDHEATEPAYTSFNVVAMQPTATGVRAAVISSYPLVHPIITTPSDGVPPEDKYYGSFIVEAAYVDGVLDATEIVKADREIVSWLPLTDGMLQVSNELPPRSNDTTLRIERLDTAGAVAWSHDEPVTGFSVDVDTLPDGTVLVAYEVASGFIHMLRLSAADGSELARASFPGSHPTVAAYGSDGALVSFNGTAPGESVVAPDRAVPLLLELDASMAVLRGAQVACTGSGDLQRATDGSLLFIGAFGQRFTIGSSVTQITPGSLILTKIAQPL